MSSLTRLAQRKSANERAREDLTGGHKLIVNSLADLVGFEGFLNTTTPFEPKEHQAVWKTDHTYLDFTFQNTYNQTCEYPRFWNESGNIVLRDSDPVFSQLVGCFDSEFDHVRIDTELQ